jgi:hypothetical protein
LAARGSAANSIEAALVRVAQSKHCSNRSAFGACIAQSYCERETFEAQLRKEGSSAAFSRAWVFNRTSSASVVPGRSEATSKLT